MRKEGLIKARLGFNYFNTAREELSFKKPDHALAFSLLYRAEELLTESLNYELPENVRKYVEQTLKEICKLYASLVAFA